MDYFTRHSERVCCREKREHIFSLISCERGSPISPLARPTPLTLLARGLRSEFGGHGQGVAKSPRAVYTRQKGLGSGRHKCPRITGIRGDPFWQTEP